MGCIGHRRKDIDVKAEQKWDYINLRDFRSKGCGTPSAYVYLWFSLILSITVYAVDSFTAVNLLVSDTWSSNIKPAIDLQYSKWIFSICIIASFVNIAFEWVRAARVMKRGNIAECYLDNLAVRWESIRLGSHGFRRFLVFTELTKSKKGAEYIALFTYFSFQSWIRVILCTGPRQVVNAFTLKAVYEADLLTVEKTFEGSLSTFFNKLRVFAGKDPRQAVILCGMAFTLVIWVFSVLFLLAAVLFYVLFLFHWVPRADGGLTGYCERKVNKALLKIVTEKVNKALEKEQENRRKAEAKAAKKNGEKPPLERAATLPTIPNVGLVDNDKLPEMPSLARAPTMTTLPAYTSRPGTSGSDFEMSPVDQRRPPVRTNTMRTNASTYSSKAPLISGAADMGYANPMSPAPTLPPTDAPFRPATSDSMRSMAARNNMAAHGGGQPGLMYTREYTETPAAMDSPSAPPRVASPAMSSVSGFSRSPPSVGPFSGVSAPTPRPYMQDGGRASPAPSMYSSRGGPMRGPPMNGPGFPPGRSATNPVRPSPALYAPQPMRNMTGSVPPRLAAQAQEDDYYGQQAPMPPSSVIQEQEEDYYGQQMTMPQRSAAQVQDADYYGQQAPVPQRSATQPPEDNYYGQQAPMPRRSATQVQDDDYYGQQAPMPSRPAAQTSAAQAQEEDDYYGQQVPMSSRSAAQTPTTQALEDDYYGQQAPMPQRPTTQAQEDNYYGQQPLVPSRSDTQTPAVQAQEDDYYNQQAPMPPRPAAQAQDDYYGRQPSMPGRGGPTPVPRGFDYDVEGQRDRRW